MSIIDRLLVKLGLKRLPMCWPYRNGKSSHCIPLPPNLRPWSTFAQDEPQTWEYVLRGWASNHHMPAHQLDHLIALAEEERCR